MRLPIVILIFAALLADLAGQSLCHFPTDQRSSHRLYAFNLFVLNPQGITLRSFESNGYDDYIEHRLFFGQAGAATINQLTTPAYWYTHDRAIIEELDPVTGRALFDFRDIYLQPGAYAIAVRRVGPGNSAPLQAYHFGVQSFSNNDIGMIGLGKTNHTFGGEVFLDTWAGCINYAVGRIHNPLTMSTEGPNGTLLVNMSASPPDVNGNTGGLSPIALSYRSTAEVTLTAPASYDIGGDHLSFFHWRIDGVQQNLYERTTSFTMDDPREAVAVYDLPKTLSLSATCDGTALAPTITCTPNDVHGASQVTAPGTLQFRNYTEVTLDTDAIVAGDCMFTGWRVNGSKVATVGTRTTMRTTVDADVVATYEPPACYRDDIGNGLGLADDELFVGRPLGFDFPLPGGGTTDRIDISSNGFLWLVSGSSTDPSPVWGWNSLTQDPPRVCAMWQDLQMPTTDSDVHFRALGDRAVVTWHRVAVAGSSQLFTAQCTLHANGRVVFSHRGELSSASGIVGVLAGPGFAPEAIDVHLQPQWTTTGDPGWWSLLFPGDLEPRVFTSSPTTNGNTGATLTSACAPATATSYGRGCPTAASFYELGDGASLNARSFSLRPNASGGYDVSEFGTSQYVTSIGTATGIGDDELVRAELPFAFPYPSNANGTTAVSLCSNGYLWLEHGATTSTAHTVIPSNLLAMPARIAAYWTDLDPSDPLSDGVYVDLRPDRAVFTWHDVVEFGGTTPHTTQLVLFADGAMTLSFGADMQAANDVLTGFSPGNGAAAVGSMPISASAPFSTSAGGYRPLQLATAWTPVLGTHLTLTVSDYPIAPTVGITLIGFGKASLDLGTLGAPGCLLLTTAEALAAGLRTAAVTTVELAIPASPLLIGESLFVQEAGYAPGLNAAGFVTSNGLELVLGEF